MQEREALTFRGGGSTGQPSLKTSAWKADGYWQWAWGWSLDLPLACPPPLFLSPEMGSQQTGDGPLLSASVPCDLLLLLFPISADGCSVILVSQANPAGDPGPTSLCLSNTPHPFVNTSQLSPGLPMCQACH